MEIREISCTDATKPEWLAWESLVANNPASGLMQSLIWAEFKRKQGLRVLHLGLYEGAVLVGGAIFYTAVNNRGAGFLVAPEGPVLPWHDGRRAEIGFRLLVKAAEQNAGRFDAMAVRVEPRLLGLMPAYMRGFGRAPLTLIPRETLYVNVARSDEELLADMKPKGRYNIRLSQRHGVTVSEGCAVEDLKRFYPMIIQASYRDHFPVEPFPFFAVLASTLCPPGVARFLFAEHEGDLLGALLLTTYGGRATYLYGGISNYKRNLMAGYALQWAAMKAARSAGCTDYDLYGFDQFCAPQNSYAKFSRFKRQFGGTVMRFIGAQDCFFLDSLADAVIKAVSEVQAFAPQDMTLSLR
jgi:lipid II:glycine glycyltransferase (peptidoglycan interpeptide bridge formation enzyme)